MMSKKGGMRFYGYYLVFTSFLVMLLSAQASDRLLLQAKPVCKPGTFSANGTNCQPCPPHAMCLRMPLPCETMPTCDPVTGKVASMCWVNKPAGSPCNPKYYGDQTIPAAEQTHVCSASGMCEAKGATNVTQKPVAPKPLPKPAANATNCPTMPMCRRLASPCEMAPSCDLLTGRPTSMCWVKKAAGSACNPNYRGDQTIPAAEQTHVCSAAGLCEAKGANATQKPVAATNATNCPTMPMCRRLATPCEMAPPCDASGRPTSMCWVQKPNGSPCTPLRPAMPLPAAVGMAVVPNRMPVFEFHCQNQQCVPKSPAATAIGNIMRPGVRP